MLKSSFSSTASSARRQWDILGGKEGNFSEIRVMITFCPVTNKPCHRILIFVTAVATLAITYLSRTDSTFQRLMVCLLKYHHLNWECLRRAKIWKALQVCCLLPDEHFSVPALALWAGVSRNIEQSFSHRSLLLIGAVVWTPCAWLCSEPAAWHWAKYWNLSHACVGIWWRSWLFRAWIRDMEKWYLAFSKHKPVSDWF